MKRVFLPLIAVFAIFLFIAACGSTPPNPEKGPQVSVTIPELFSPDPDNARVTTNIGIEVNHPVAIKNWTITIQPNRRQNTTASQPRQEGQQREAGQQREGGQRERQEGQERRSRVFFEASGNKAPPSVWHWNGRGNSGELVQSATDYRFTLVVNDIYDNSTTYEGIINIDVLVRKEGDQYRIIVPSITFPPNSSDFRLLTEDERRENNRIIMLIARALNRFEDYAISVEGHANPTTPPNTAERTTEEAGTRTIIGLQPLSEQRAAAVINQLVTGNNIDRARLTAVGMGGLRTVAAYNDEDENWKNRRVEFILHK